MKKRIIVCMMASIMQLSAMEEADTALTRNEKEPLLINETKRPQSIMLYSSRKNHMYSKEIRKSISYAILTLPVGLRRKIFVNLFELDAKKVKKLPNNKFISRATPLKYFYKQREYESLQSKLIEFTWSDFMDLSDDIHAQLSESLNQLRENR